MDNLSQTQFTFDIRDQSETELVMRLFGDYLCTEMEEERANLVRRIAFESITGTGKTTAINALFQTFGDYMVYEKVNAGERNQQQLIFSDRVGWVRQYDSTFIGWQPQGLPSSKDTEIWQHSDPSKEIPDLGVGLDIVEHPKGPIEKNKDFDIIVQLEITSLYYGKSINYSHELAMVFKAKQDYIDDPHFMAFIHLIQPVLDNHRAAKVENESALTI